MNENVDIKYKQYALDVVNKKIVACTYVRQACQRYLDFFDKYEFRTDKVDKVVKFISKLEHFTGQFNRQKFVLLPYQYWIVCAIFGFYRPDGRRLTRYVYIELARKSGKTSLVAAIQLYMMCADGENNAEVHLLANSAKQASICFKMCSEYLGSIDKKNKYFKRYRDSILFDKAKSSIKVLAAEANLLDGSNAHSYVLDEAHEMKDDSLWAVELSGQGMRLNPLAMIITTAGFSKDGFCYQYRSTCVDILSGSKEQDNQFCAIYTQDSETEWDKPEMWIKSNPSLDVTVQKDYLEEQVTNAKNNPQLEPKIKTKNFNMWLDVAQTWIPRETLLKYSEKIDFMEPKWKDQYAYVGLDLAEVSDLTAATWMIPLDSKFYFYTKYYYPEGKLQSDINCDMYKQWIKDGYMTLTPGEVTDYDYILNDLLHYNTNILYSKICYDPYNAVELTNAAQNTHGLPMTSFSQSLWHFNIPTKNFERLLKLGRCVIDYNPVTLWCFANVVLKEDFNANVKPVKGSGRSFKIDGTISMVEALGGWIETPFYDEYIVTG